MEEDQIWINLKVVAKLLPQNRLNTQSSLFQIERNSAWNPVGLWRYFRGDSRASTMMRLNVLVDAAIRSCIELGDGSKRERLEDHLSACCDGIQNLRQTYADDVTTVASIDRLVDKINDFTQMLTTVDVEEGE